MQRSSRGFWLSEVLTSIWLVSFIGISLLGLFVYLTKASKISNERAAAELLADRLLERSGRYGPPDWGLEPGQVGTLVPSTEGHENTLLSYRVDAKPLEDHRLGTLYLIQTKVYWTPAPGAPNTNVERGSGSLTRDRQIYVEDTAETPEAEP